MSDNDWFSRYKFLQPIGQGGMGTVFLAEDRSQNNARRVIKQMIHKSGDDHERSESVRLFRREAEILRSLDHEGIVKIHDSHASNDGKYFLVMDEVPGKNLEMIVNSKGGPLTSEEVVRIAIHCCDVLEYLHTRTEPIIYRDLKPSNLMLTPEGRIIFIDFGIARLMPKEAATRVVTAGYSPPEQYFGRPETRSDIYSLGATMHHLLTGVRPKPLTACNPTALNPAVMPTLNALVRKMTAHDIDDRPPNIQTVKYELYKIYKELHPEFEIPEWMEQQYDQRSHLEEAARLKYGRMNSGAERVVPSGGHRTVNSSQQATVQNNPKSRTSSERQPQVRNLSSAEYRTLREHEQEAADSTPLTKLVGRVKRWLGTTLRL